MKRIRSVFTILLSLATLFSLALPAAAQAESGYPVEASAAMLLDLDSGQVLFEQDADKTIYPASLTKIMTCLLALENGNLSDTVTVSETALQNLHEDGSNAGLQAGEELTLEQLLYCVMLASANEGCNVVAEYISGSIEAFVELMNQRAAELGCTGTHFANTHGLHDEQHYTTARDLSLITQAALRNETFAAICDTIAYTVPATNLSDERNLRTTNFLISSQDTAEYYYSKASGVKTGYTSQAGRCVISTATDGNLNLLGIVCGAETIIRDSGDLLLCNFTEAKALFEYGFDSFQRATLASPLEPLGKTQVRLSSDADSAVFAPQDTITVILPKDYDETKIERRILLDSDNGVDAPVSSGQRLGTLQVYYDGELLGETDLVSIADISRSEIDYAVNEAGNFFHSSAWHWAKVALLFLLILLFFLIILRIQLRRRARRRRMEARRRAAARDHLREVDRHEPR